MAAEKVRGYDDDTVKDAREVEDGAVFHANVARDRSLDPEVCIPVGGVALQTELAPALGWRQAAVNAGYIALRRAQPQFRVYQPPPGSRDL